MLGPTLGIRNVEHVEQLAGEGQVRDLVPGVNVVDLTYDAFVQDGVKCVCRIASVEIPSCVLTVPMDP